MLSGAGAVVIEPPMSGLAGDLDVTRFPTFVEVNDTGTVVRAAMSARALAATAART